MSPIRRNLRVVSLALVATFAGGLRAAEPAVTLPQGALVRLGSERFRQPYQRSPIIHVILSADGKVLASRSDEKTIRIWDAATGQLLRQIEEPDGAAAFAFSPSGKLLATAGGGNVRTYDIPGCKLQKQWLAHENGIAALAFTPDNQGILTGSPDRTVRLWDLAGKETRKFGDELDAIVDVAVSPDGKIVAACGKRVGVYLWDTDTARELKQLKGDESRQFGIAFSPDSKTLALGSKITVRLFDVAEGKELRQFGHEVNASTDSFNNDEALAFSPDGTHVVTGGKVVRVWETATAKKIASFSEARKRANAVLFAADGKFIIASGGDRQIRFWDIATGKLQRDLTGHQDRVTCVAMSPDGKLVVTGGADRAVFLWDAVTGKLLRPLPGHEAGISAVAFALDGKRVAAGDTSGILRVWDVDTGKELHLLQPHKTPINALGFSPDGKALASAGQDGHLILYDIAKEREIREFPRHVNGATAVAFSPDGKLIATGAGNGQIRVWKMQEGDEVMPPPRDGPVPIDNIRKEAALFQPPQPGPGPSPVLQIVFSPDGSRLTSWLESGAIVLQETVSRKVLLRFDGPAAAGSRGSFSADGKVLAIRDANRRLSLREVATGQERLSLPGHPGHEFISAVAVSPDGRRLVSVSEDTTALVWDVTGRLRDGTLQPAKPTAKELEILWRDLAGDKGAPAHAAVWTLVASPDAMAFLQEKLKPVPVDPKHLEKLLAELDSEKFQVRQQAFAALEELGELAEDALKGALKSGPPLAVRQNLDKLLARIDKERFALSPHRLRVLRTTEALEQIGTPEARKLLELLGDAPPELRLTADVKLEAKACLTRMDRRAGK